MVLRLADTRITDPSAVIFRSRTVHSTGAYPAHSQGDVNTSRTYSVFAQCWRVIRWLHLYANSLTRH